MDARQLLRLAGTTNGLGMCQRFLGILVIGTLTLCACAVQPARPPLPSPPVAPPLIADVPLLVTTYVDSNGNRQPDSADLPLANVIITLITAVGTTTVHRTNTEGRMLLDFAYQINGSGPDVFPITARVTSPDPQLYVLLSSAEVQLNCCNPQTTFLFASATQPKTPVGVTTPTSSR